MMPSVQNLLVLTIMSLKVVVKALMGTATQPFVLKRSSSGELFIMYTTDAHSFGTLEVIDAH